MATSKQLLFRAGEIKQPKRREALIENAEKARISRQLVLLDDKVDLDVPLDDLAVHEPDARKLIAFLKAMEFSTLTRRVADYSQIDPSDVEADAGNKSAASGASGAPASAKAAGGATGDLFAAPDASRQAGGRQAGQGREPQGHADFARRRARGSGPEASGRSQQVPDHPQPRSSSRPGSRAPDDVGHFAIDAKANSDRSDAGRHLRHRAGAGAERCLLRPARPQAIRRRRRPVRRRPRTRPDQGRRRAGGVEAAAGISRHSQDRLQHQVQRRDAGAARHHAAQPSTTRS